MVLAFAGDSTITSLRPLVRVVVATASSLARLSPLRAAAPATDRPGPPLGRVDHDGNAAGPARTNPGLRTPSRRSQQPVRDEPPDRRQQAPPQGVHRLLQQGAERTHDLAHGEAPGAGADQPG